MQEIQFLEFKEGGSNLMQDSPKYFICKNKYRKVAVQRSICYLFANELSAQSGCF